MGTFAQLKAEIAVDLTRSDLTTQINQAVLDAVYNHGSERFWFNETRAYELALSDGTSEYSISAQVSPPISEFIHIDWIELFSGTTYLDELERIDARELARLHSTTTEGQPAWWAYYGDKLRFYPTPGASYTAKIAGHFRLPVLSADADTTVWTNAARMLIRYAALKKLFLFPPKDPEKSIGAGVMELQELQFLRTETDRRKRMGQMAAYY